MNIELVEVYYPSVAGAKVLPQRYCIKEPESNGYARALLIPGKKRSMLFDPFNFKGWDIPNDAGEINVLDKETRRPVPSKRYEVDVERWKAFMLRKWHEFSKLGMQKDWVRASMIISELGAEVPKVMTEEAVVAMIANGEEVDESVIIQKSRKQRSKGKELVAERFKPLKRDSKRGSVCDFFLQDKAQPIVECMAKLEMTRSNVLSHLSCANRDQGWGYDLVGDCVKVNVPDGVEPWVPDVLD